MNVIRNVVTIDGCDEPLLGLVSSKATSDPKDWQVVSNP